VISGTVTFKVGDDVFEAGPQTAVKMTGEDFYSLHNDTDSEAEVFILSTAKVAEYYGQNDELHSGIGWYPLEEELEPLRWTLESAELFLRATRRPTFRARWPRLSGEHSPPPPRMKPCPIVVDS